MNAALDTTERLGRTTASPTLHSDAVEAAGNDSNAGPSKVTAAMAGVGFLVCGSIFLAATHGRGVNQVEQLLKGADQAANIAGHSDGLAARLAQVDHFVFDLDSTLTDYYKASKVLRQTMSSELVKATGLPRTAIDESLKATERKLGSSYFYNDLNQVDALRKVYPGEDLNVKFADVSAQSKKAYHDVLKAPQETVDLLQYLRSQGKSVHVFTASPTGRAMDKLNASGLLPYIDHIFTGGPHAFDDLASSGMITADSPMNRVTQLPWNAKLTGEGHKAVLDYLQTTPDKVAMIGDSVEQDMTWAQRLGMFTAQATWYVKEPTQAILPDLQLTNPQNLAHIMQAVKA